MHYMQHFMSLGIEDKNDNQATCNRQPTISGWQQEEQTACQKQNVASQRTQKKESSNVLGTAHT